jgi:heme exporter protein CcmD
MNLQELTQFFDFLPYGKHSFYIFLSYFICILSLGILIIKSKTSLNKTKNQLKIKYFREQA